jgi:hypothetical protein
VAVSDPAAGCLRHRHPPCSRKRALNVPAGERPLW